MKNYFNIFNDKVALSTTLAAGGLLLGCLAFIGIFYKQLPLYLPLYNRLSWGYARLGNTYEIFIPLAVAAGCIIFNLLYGKRMQNTSPLIARFLFLTNLLLAVFTTIFLLKLILIIV